MKRWKPFYVATAEGVELADLRDPKIAVAVVQYLQKQQKLNARKSAKGRNGP